MKRFLSSILAAAMVLSLAACGGQSSAPVSSQNPGASGSPSAERKLKDTITFAQSADITSLDPQKIVNLRSFAFYSNMYEGLVALDEKGEVVPALAESWETVDELTTKFSLRKGVKFHDGSEMKAADVKFSFDRMMASGIVSTYLQFLDSVEVVDDYTVLLHSKVPYAQMLVTLTIPCCAIVPKAVVEADPEGFTQKPVGTGPYKFVEWREADFAKMEAFDGYWGEKAKTPYVVMKVVPEGAQRTIMLESGEVDISYDIMPNDGSRIEEAKNLTLLHEVGQKFTMFYFKPNSTGPVGNPLVRQAISMAIDRDAILQAVSYGYGQPGSLLATPNTKGYNAAKEAASYNPEQAKALLTQAGYPNGFDMTLWSMETQQYVEIAQIIQSQLLEIGINAKVEVLDSNTLNEKYYSGEEIEARMGFYNNLAGDMDFVMQKLSTDAYGQMYVNPKMDELRDAARAENDVAARQVVYDQVFDILNVDIPWCVLYYEENLVGISNNVEGFQMSSIGAHSFQNVVVYQ